MLEEWIRKSMGENNSAKRFLNPKKKKYLLVVLICLGLLALIWPATEIEPSAPQVTDNHTPEVKTATNKTKMAGELETILAEIEGAGRVHVSLSLSSDGIKSYASNVREEKRDIQETDNKGLKKNTSEHNTTRDLAVSSGSPLLIEEKRPEILGVLIVADGAKNSLIAEQLTNAAATLLNISPHKVTVMPRGGKDNANYK